MRTIVHVQNLKCGGCENTIINRLSELVGICDVEVNQENETVAFTYNTPHDFETTKHLLSRIGYPIIGQENKLITKAASYVSCAIGRIKK